MQDIIKKPVVLVGMMGAGKSYLGSKLAQKLDIPFYDSDAFVEEKAGCSIAQIFERDGEGAFRILEREALEELIQGIPCVIASGGGAFVQEETRAVIKGTALSIWLNVDHEMLYERVRGETHRPLLKTKNPKEVLGRLVKEREPIYAQADFAITDCGQNSSEMLEKMIKCVYAHNKI